MAKKGNSRRVLRALGLGLITGAAYDLAQTFGWKHGLHAKAADTKKFYGAIVAFTVAGMSINFLGLNPMKVLVWSGIVQGFSTPPLMLLIMLTTAIISAATAGLVITWLK